jgi:hypothetical protein
MNWSQAPLTPVIHATHGPHRGFPRRPYTDGLNSRCMVQREADSASLAPAVTATGLHGATLRRALQYRRDSFARHVQASLTLAGARKRMSAGRIYWGQILCVLAAFARAWSSRHNGRRMRSATSRNSARPISPSLGIRSMRPGSSSSGGMPMTPMRDLSSRPAL